MRIWRQDFRILSSDVDLTRKIRLSTLFTKLQEAAIAHTIELGVTREKTLDRGLLWAVTQYRLKIDRMPEYDERVTLLSWPGKTMHLYFPRYFRLQDEKGEVLLDAVSLWVLISEKTRSIVFPEDHGIEIPETRTEYELPLPGRLRKEETAVSHSFTVPYSYVDLNGHMNNARYYDLAQDIMPEDTRSRELKALTSEYIGEARLGNTLSAGYALSENACYVCGSTEKPLFRMKFEFAGKEEKG
jgi:medium-chain acyl-[acyl-carrier-protein] hydrolase